MQINLFKKTFLNKKSQLNTAIRFFKKFIGITFELYLRASFKNTMQGIMTIDQINN